jgi:hypothetical protein
MSKADDMITASRRKAQAAFSRTKEQDAGRIAARDKERQAQDAKIARLRDLRLAKEAADRVREQTAAQTRPARRKPTAEASG